MLGREKTERAWSRRSTRGQFVGAPLHSGGILQREEFLVQIYSTSSRPPQPWKQCAEIAVVEAKKEKLQPRLSCPVIALSSNVAIRPASS